MISRVVFEFSIAGGVFPRLTNETEAHVRVIAVPRSRRPVPAFEQHRDGKWHQMPLGDVPPELLITLAALLAGAPQPGKPLFMETRIERPEGWRGRDTLTISLGRIDGAAFEAVTDVPMTVRSQQRWLERITMALGVDHYSLAIEAISNLQRERDDAKEGLSRMNEALNNGHAAAQALMAIAEDLHVLPSTVPAGWTNQARDACLHTISAMRSTIDAQASDHLSDLSLITEPLGIKPLELSADTRDAIIKEIGSLKTHVDSQGERFQILKQALLSVAREINTACDDTDEIGTIRNRAVNELRNERQKTGHFIYLLRQEITTMRAEVDRVVNELEDEHRTTDLILKALGLGLPTGGTDARDRIIRAIEALKADWPANLAACAELVHDREERGVAFRNERMDDALVATIADGRANYKAEPLDAILHATTLAHEVRAKRAEMSTLKERAQSLLAVLTRICRRAGCMLPNATLGDIADAEQRILGAFDHLYQERNNAMRERNQAYDTGISVSEALRAVAEAAGIDVRPTEDGAWAEPTRSQIVTIIEGLKEIDQKAADSAANAARRAALRHHGLPPIPMRLPCPDCSALHIDQGEFITKPHHTHACQICGNVWRPAVVDTVGVLFLPGFRNEATETTGLEQSAALALAAKHAPPPPSGEMGTIPQWVIDAIIEASKNKPSPPGAERDQISVHQE